MPEKKEKLVFPEIDQLIDLPELNDVQISPDGRYIVYSESTPDWETNEFRTQLWLIEVATKQTTQLTWQEQSSDSPRWSSDSSQISFLSQRQGDKQTCLYSISPTGGESKQVCKFDTDIEKFCWSPDDRLVAFLAVPPESEKSKQQEGKYGSVHIEDETFHKSTLWVFDVSTRKTRRLVFDERHIVDMDWAPDSNQIAFESWASPDVKEFDKGIIFSVNLESLDCLQISLQGSSQPRWSPDGASIGFSRVCKPTMMANNEICIVSANGGDIHVVPDDFDEEMTLLSWGPSGLYFSAPERTAYHLYKLDVNSGKTERVTPVNVPGWYSDQFSFSTDHSGIACIAFNRDQYSEVMFLDPGTGQAEPLTQYNNRLSNWKLALREVIQWQSLDGTEIEGVLTRPLDYEPGRKYPLLVVIHGGPTSASPQALMAAYDCRYYPIQQWAAQGAFILEPNYRGSTGYGEEFRKLNINNLGVGDYEDVISGVDFLIEKGWVDSERLGVMGWSQGGYISAFITTFSDRFRAVSVGAGISSWATYYVNTDIHPFVMDYLGATPWDDPDAYERSAPMHYIKQACTPTLIQHGELDKRVPIPNAYELYQGLQDMGVETRLVIYKGMPHGIKKPKQARHVMQENYDWFNKRVLDDQENDCPSRTCYVYVSRGKPDQEVNPCAISDVYLSELKGLLNLARQDSAEFRVLCVDGLVSTEKIEETEIMDASIDPERLLTILQTQIKEAGWQNLVIYTNSQKENPEVQKAVGSLYSAAGLLRNVHIELKGLNSP